MNEHESRPVPAAGVKVVARPGPAEEVGPTGELDPDSLLSLQRLVGNDLVGKWAAGALEPPPPPGGPMGGGGSGTAGGTAAGSDAGGAAGDGTPGGVGNVATMAAAAAAKFAPTEVSAANGRSSGIAGPPAVAGGYPKGGGDTTSGEVADAKTDGFADTTAGGDAKSDGEAKSADDATSSAGSKADGTASGGSALAAKSAEQAEAAKAMDEAGAKVDDLAGAAKSSGTGAAKSASESSAKDAGGAGRSEAKDKGASEATAKEASAGAKGGPGANTDPAIIRADSGGAVGGAKAGGAAAAARGGAAGADVADLTSVNTELAIHQQWAQVGPAAAAAGGGGPQAGQGPGTGAPNVGATGSDARAAFLVDAAGAGLLHGAGQGFEQGFMMGLGLGLLEHAVPIPGLGLVIGGAMALHGIIDNWDNTAATIGAMGTGASIYEQLANDLAGLGAIIDLICQILNVIGGIAGAIAIVMWIVTMATLGAATPLAATISTIAGLALLGVGIFNALAQAVIQPCVALFRAMHAFTMEASPAAVAAQGAKISAATGIMGGQVGGLAGAIAGGATAKGLVGEPPPAVEPPPRPAPAEGPPGRVAFEPPVAPEGPVPVAPEAPVPAAPEAPVPVAPEGPVPAAPEAPVPASEPAPGSRPAPAGPETMPAPPDADLPYNPTEIPEPGTGIPGPEIPRPPKMPNIPDLPWGPEPDVRPNPTGPLPESPYAPTERPPAPGPEAPIPTAPEAPRVPAGGPEPGGPGPGGPGGPGDAGPGGGPPENLPLATSDNFYELPGQNPATGEGLQTVDVYGRGDPARIMHHDNLGFKGVGEVTVADAADVPAGGPAEPGGSRIPAGTGDVVDVPVYGKGSPQEGQPRPVEVRTHGPNPAAAKYGPDTYSANNATTQLNTNKGAYLDPSTGTFGPPNAEAHMPAGDRYGPAGAKGPAGDYALYGERPTPGGPVHEVYGRPGQDTLPEGMSGDLDVILDESRYPGAKGGGPGPGGAGPPGRPAPPAPPAAPAPATPALPVADSPQTGGPPPGIDPQIAVDPATGKGVEVVQPNYKNPPGTPQQIAAIQAEIGILQQEHSVAKAAQAKHAALEAEHQKFAGDVAKANAVTAQAVAGAKSHQGDVAAKEANNAQQTAKHGESQDKIKSYPDRAAGIAVMRTPLGVFRSFTHYASMLPGEVGAKFHQMNSEATRFDEALDRITMQMAAQAAQGPAQLLGLQQDKAQLAGVKAASSASEQVFTQQNTDTQALQAKNDQKLALHAAEKEKAGGQTAKTEGEVKRKERASVSLADQLRSWTDDHRAERQRATEATKAKYDAHGFRATVETG